MREVNPKFWVGKRVFLTGHTGFKGSWLSLWLQSLGAEVFGFALNPPTTPSLFVEADVAKGMRSTIGDIRDYAAVISAIKNCNPDIIIHMAAQPLVRYSYKSPIETYSINVMGTVHLYEAARQVESVKAIVNVTTDKCYENKEWVWGYREDDSIGGHDPYSNSKGCSELVTNAFRSSFMQNQGIALASARAGNVIGGGDWAADRLVPDILKAFEQSKQLIIRNPHAIRPWQHVLEPLAGYLILAESLYLEGDKFSEGWNFGPQNEGAQSVKWIVEKMAKHLGIETAWDLSTEEQPHEATYLKLDISKSRTRLGWRPRWDLETALSYVINWHQYWLRNRNAQVECLRQIRDYQNKQI